ncbi:MAG: hypothetical protein QG549_46 [Patescibacteria group bacterium]|nr:hypothetical protein [Patescibacteria group bacterium]
MTEIYPNAENHSEQADTYLKASIGELLPRYHETHDGVRYEIIRSITVDGHEVAWMEYRGAVQTASENGAVSIHEYSGRALKCACDFTEGVGWKCDDKWGVVGMMRSSGDCIPTEAAKYMRLLELRREYLERFPNDTIPMGDEYDLWDKVPEIILDLIEKGKQGEWLSEGSSGAHDWGGYFYLQTVQEITGIPYDQLWDHVYKMQAEKQIQLEGMVVQEYSEPPEPKWEEYARLEYGGYTGIAKLPAHSRMPQHWEIVILAQNGRTIAEGIEGPALTHSPDFGVDVDDAATVEAAIKSVIDGYLWDPMRQA